VPSDARAVQRARGPPHRMEAPSLIPCATRFSHRPHTDPWAPAPRVIHSLPARPTGLTTRFPGLSFGDGEGTTGERLALEPGDRGGGGLVVGHLDEAKAFGTARVAVGNDMDRLYQAIRLKELAEVVIGDGKRQIAYIDIHSEVP